MANAKVITLMSESDLALCVEIGLVERAADSRREHQLTSAGIALIQPGLVPSLMDRARQAFNNRHNVDRRYSRDNSWRQS